MKRIYAIVINDIAKERELKLSALLGEDESTKSSSFFVTKGMKTTWLVSDTLKTYKTLNGALNEVNRCNKFLNNTQIRLPQGEVINGMYTHYFKFDTSKYTFSYVDVTDKWNEFVNNSIDKENDKHEKIITKLKKKLII
jgi:hypothetical protein